MSEYQSFLARKALVARDVGLPEIPALNDRLFGFQRDIVSWALRRGRAAVFADCGLGKSAIQLEWARVVAKHVEPYRVLVLAPLAVAQQTVRESEKFGIDGVRYQRDGSIGDAQIVVTNYEMLHRWSPADFAGIVLDESSILKAYDGKTRTEIIQAFGRTPFRLACTATPAPNDHMELGNHSEFLGIMTRAEMLSMFFVHDGGETQKWRLKGHAEKDFWRWVCSWAVMLRRPSDLGYDDGDFSLPPIDVRDDIVKTSNDAARARGLLFDIEARTLDERRSARRASLSERVARAAELANTERAPWLIWGDLNAETNALERAIDGAVQVSGSDDAETKEERMLGFSEGRYRVLVTKPSIAGFGMNWQHCARMAFVGLSDSYEQIYQATRRCWRFGQKQPVRVHIITSEAEGATAANIRRKEAEADKMAREMVHHMSAISSSEIRGARRDVTEYKPSKSMALPRWMNGGAI